MDQAHGAEGIHFTRRTFWPLAAGLAAGMGAWPGNETWGRTRGEVRPRIAAIFTVLRFRSHAYNILENFLGPFHFNGQLVDPGVDVVSFYADQRPEDDLAVDVSERFSIPLCDTIEQALYAGGQELSVDGVLIIGEHGDYPYNELGQHLYPRKRFFDESVAVMRRAGRYLPVFNDKHFSWSWDEAREMYDTARRHRMPLMAGSSVPLAQRIPPLELPPGAEIEEAVSVHGGGLESYDFHGLEVLQSLVESRRGGETGIAGVELLTGDDYERARKAGRWSEELVEAAMAAEEAMDAPRQPHPQVGVMRSGASARQPGPVRRPPPGPYAICLTYRDGLRATVLRLGSDANRWNFACRLRGEPRPRATAFFNSPWGNRGLFKALSHAIQHLFRTGQEPYPVERTLLTTGAVEAVMHSYQSPGTAIETPHLPWERRYQTETAGASQCFASLRTAHPQPPPSFFVAGAKGGFASAKTARSPGPTRVPRLTSARRVTRGLPWERRYQTETAGASQCCASLRTAHPQPPPSFSRGWG
jgi:hypothetical protein